MALWQWTGLAVAAALLCMVVRQQQPEMASLCALAAGVMLLISALESVTSLQDTFARLASMSGLHEGYLSMLLKVLGIAYTAELAAQTCADLGENGLAMKVALVGKLAIFVMAAPMLLSLLEMILELVP
ncbi:MAG: stage III sporulation AC/AD family protein [Candidatus Limiplasma sp.]|nr:stage III sporulation AC/AD family protein [Candidatus Limiplasma sp.]